MVDEENKESSSTSSAVIGVFLNRTIIVDHYKTIAEAINTNETIRNLADGGRVVVITKKKSGFTRQLLIGDLEAQPFEYTVKDWEYTTQRHKHLPDLLAARKPSVFIVVGEDASLLIAVLLTVYNQTNRPLTEADVRHVIDAAEQDLRIGDVCLYNREGYSAEDPGGVFSILYSLQPD